MRKARLASAIGLLSMFSSVCVQAQQQAVTAPPVPTLVNFSGKLSDVNGKPLTGIVGVTFYLYKDSEGGAPLWMETQNVQPDRTGHYAVMLGATTGVGLPTVCSRLAKPAGWACKSKVKLSRRA